MKKGNIPTLLEVRAMYEVEMIDQIRDFIIESGYEPYDQIKFFYGKIDFVGINNENDCIVIESKVDKWRIALNQIVNYGHGADTSYIALPAKIANNVFKKHKQIFYDNQVGLLSVGLDGEKKINILIESLSKYCSPVYKKYLLYSVNGRKNRSKKRINLFKEKYSNII